MGRKTNKNHKNSICFQIFYLFYHSNNPSENDQISMSTVDENCELVINCAITKCLKINA